MFFKKRLPKETDELGVLINKFDRTEALDFLEETLANHPKAAYTQKLLRAFLKNGWKFYRISWMLNAPKNDFWLFFFGIWEDTAVRKACLQHILEKHRGDVGFWKEALRSADVDMFKSEGHKEDRLRARNIATEQFMQCDTSSIQDIEWIIQNKSLLGRDATDLILKAKKRFLEHKISENP